MCIIDIYLLILMYNIHYNSENMNFIQVTINVFFI